MDYYNLESILAEEEKLKVQFPCNINNFGFFLNQCTEVIEKETKVNFPMFLVKFLIQNEVCTVISNKYEQIKFDLEAEASIVNLENKYFYSVSKLKSENNFLKEVFFSRIGAYVSYMLKNDFTEDDVSNLSAEEKILILKARKVFKKQQDFFNELEVEF